LAFANCDNGVSGVPDQSGQSTMPVAEAGGVGIRSTETPDEIQFKLRSTNNGTWKVYDAAGIIMTSASANFTAPVLTLSDPLFFFPVGTYYVTVTEPGKTESEKLALSVTESVTIDTYTKASTTALDSTFSTAARVMAALKEQPYWNMLSFVGTAFDIASLFLPEQESVTDQKLDAITNQLNDIQSSITALEKQIDSDTVNITDSITETDMQTYVNEVSSATQTAVSLNGNSIDLANAKSVFADVDSNTGEYSPNTYHNVCQELFSTGNTALNIDKQVTFYDDYFKLANLILGTNNQWFNGPDSASDAYETYLSKVYDYNTQTFTQRQAFLDSLYNTFSVLTMYITRAAQYDLDFNCQMYESYMAAYYADDTNADEKLLAKDVADAAKLNYEYDQNVLLDPKAENTDSITYMSQQVLASLTASQEKLQKEEAAAEILPITGTMISASGAAECTTTAKETYSPLIYSYRLGKYLNKNLTQVPSEQYVRLGEIGGDYEISPWEKSEFRTLTAAQQTAIDNELKGDAMNTLSSSAVNRATNIIDDLSSAGFTFSFVDQQSGIKSWYILGMGAAWATAPTGDYRTIYEEVIIWGCMGDGPPPDTSWTDGSVVTYSKTAVWSIYAIEWYDKEESITAGGLWDIETVPDPDILSYGSTSALPAAIQPPS